jgi:hypothetical protein
VKATEYRQSLIEWRNIARQQMAENQKLREALARIASGEMPDGIDTPCQPWVSDIARAALDREGEGFPKATTHLRGKREDYAELVDEDLWIDREGEGK